MEINNLLMSIAVKHNYTPIKGIYTALSDFSPELDSENLSLPEIKFVDY